MIYAKKPFEYFLEQWSQPFVTWWPGWEGGRGELGRMNSTHSSEEEEAEAFGA